MSDLVSLSTLIYRSRFESDMINSTQALDSDFTNEINSALRELYDMMVEGGDPDYFSSTYTMSTVGGTSQYSLPSDFKSMTAVYNVDPTGAGRIWPLQSVKQGEIGRYTAPQGAYPITIEYVPSPPTLTNPSTDSFDFVSGWSEVVVLMVARKMLRRQRRDVGPLEDAIQQQKQRLVAAIPKRDRGGPRYVNDVDEETRFRGYYASTTLASAYRIVGNSLYIYSESSFYPV